MQSFKRIYDLHKTSILDIIQIIKKKISTRFPSRRHCHTTPPCARPRVPGGVPNRQGPAVPHQGRTQPVPRQEQAQPEVRRQVPRGCDRE